MLLVTPPVLKRKAGSEQRALRLIGRVLALELDEAASLGIGMTNPIPVYSVTSDEGGADLLSQAHLTSWKSFVFTGNELLGEVDYKIEGQGGLGDPISFRRGNLCSALIRGVRRAEKARGQGEQPWELNILIVDLVYFLALWLRDAAGQRELFLPVPSVNRRFKPFRFYTREELQIDIRAAIEERMSFRSRL